MIKNHTDELAMTDQYFHVFMTSSGGPSVNKVIFYVVLYLPTDPRPTSQWVVVVAVVVLNIPCLNIYE